MRSDRFQMAHIHSSVTDWR